MHIALQSPAQPVCVLGAAASAPRLAEALAGAPGHSLGSPGAGPRSRQLRAQPLTIPNRTRASRTSCACGRKTGASGPARLYAPYSEEASDPASFGPLDDNQRIAGPAQSVHCQQPASGAPDELWARSAPMSGLAGGDVGRRIASSLPIARPCRRGLPAGWSSKALGTHR